MDRGKELARKAWKGMMNRCYTTTNKDYPAIGGKGIKVCKRWHNFENFLEDMGPKPDGTIFQRWCDGLDFTPDNCHWLPQKNTSGNLLYSRWKGIKRRTDPSRYSPNHTIYKARGIDICDDWRESFEVFAADVGEPPTPMHQLDRIDNGRGYFPDNVRWVLPGVNANNRTDNVFIEFGGQRKTLSEWAVAHNIPVPTLYGRFARLFNPVNVRDRFVHRCDMDGNILQTYQSVKEAARESGVSNAAISKCLCGGNASAGGFKWRR